MVRSLKKGVYVDSELLKYALFQSSLPVSSRKVIRTMSRRSTIVPEFEGLTFLVHNGHKLVPVTVNAKMVWHKFGEFSHTRTYRGHAANKKGKI